MIHFRLRFNRPTILESCDLLSPSAKPSTYWPRLPTCFDTVTPRTHHSATGPHVVSITILPAPIPCPGKPEASPFRSHPCPLLTLCPRRAFRYHLDATTFPLPFVRELDSSIAPLLCRPSIVRHSRPLAKLPSFRIGSFVERCPRVYERPRSQLRLDFIYRDPYHRPLPPDPRSAIIDSGSLRQKLVLPTAIACDSRIRDIGLRFVLV